MLLRYCTLRRDTKISYIQSPFIMALRVVSLVSDNVFPCLMYLLLFSVLPLSIKIMHTPKWGMKTLAYSWKAEGSCHKIWLVGHLCRHELWKKAVGNAILQGTYGQKFTRSLGRDFCYPDGCQNSWSLHSGNETERVNQISMNDDVGTSMCATFLVYRPLMNAFIMVDLF